ncbi:recQ-mediated genome instability protein 1 [Lampris incognitus]|uniref:recQ-mediated genome instability protein 1 n=1 Tax=Lampris incognitus TaxID=2546036 RepID=UPI0024B56E0C|nr:recQ-mediated genome instability protein 1 [Lampris incognitus]
MALETNGVVGAIQAWLQSSQHVQVPFDWLNACVEWLRIEGGREGRLSQQHINQQVLDQWLLADLRDLGHPVLPDGLSQAQKTELSGTFCVQVDSLLDISQPAYGQLQKFHSTYCTNDEVSAITQTTQKPWEAKPTRMLLLQVTDGVQSLEAMEYQPIPALNTSLRPGVKLKLQGPMVCRLGVLLLGPANVTVLGGEVEDMVHRNSQGRVLCRALGLPEEEQQIEAEEQQEMGEVLPIPEPGNQEMDDFELDDQELLASLEAQELVERAQEESSLESGYGTLSVVPSQSYQSSSIRSNSSTASFGIGVSTPSYSGSANQNNRSGLVQGHHRRKELQDSAIVAPFSSTHSTNQEVIDYNVAEEDLPDDFDDLPLDELDSVIFQESSTVTPQSDSTHTSTPHANKHNRLTAKLNSFDEAVTPQTDQLDSLQQQETLTGSRSCISADKSRFIRPDNSQSLSRQATGQLKTMTSKSYFSSPQPRSHDSQNFLAYRDRDLIDVDMDSCFPDKIESCSLQAKFDHTHSITAQTEEASRDGPLGGHVSGSLGGHVHQRPEGSLQTRVWTNTAATSTEPSHYSYGLTSQASSGVEDKFCIKTEAPFESPQNTPQGPSNTSGVVGSGRMPDKKNPRCNVTSLTTSLTSPPFTYLCLLQNLTSSQPHPHGSEIRVKAFIVTLLGKLTSNSGVWRVWATISDGTGYLEVELSDEMLTGLLGFSVVEKGALKRDPTRRGEVDAGMKRCQEELVDMCCVMTIAVEAEGRKAVVTRANPVTENDFHALEQRIRDRRV